MSKPCRRPLSEIVEEYKTDIRVWFLPAMQPDRYEADPKYPHLLRQRRRGGIKDRMRWKLICLLHDEAGLTWEATYECASEISKGTSIEGGLEIMRTSYKKVQRTLPKEERRSRGCKPRPLG